MIPARGTVAFVGMSNVLSEEKKQQVVALGRLGWPLRRIEHHVTSGIAVYGSDPLSRGTSVTHQKTTSTHWTAYPARGWKGLRARAFTATLPKACPLMTSGFVSFAPPALRRIAKHQTAGERVKAQPLR
ncbi:MAG: hypothetical protein DMG76_29055 [Acidobacteria bacterium]|nr:MAG: hypothetical protein DMG76_29055 [Acidobacteriota bacterium]